MECFSSLTQYTVRTVKHYYHLFLYCLKTHCHCPFISWPLWTLLYINIFPCVKTFSLFFALYLYLPFVLVYSEISKLSVNGSVCVSVDESWRVGVCMVWECNFWMWDSGDHEANIQDGGKSFTSSLNICHRVKPFTSSLNICPEACCVKVGYRPPPTLFQCRGGIFKLLKRPPPTLFQCRGGIFKLLRRTRNRFRQPIVCSLAYRYDNRIPTRLLAPIDCSKSTGPEFGIDSWGSLNAYKFGLCTDPSILFKDDVTVILLLGVSFVVGDITVYSVHTTV